MKSLVTMLKTMNPKDEFLLDTMKLTCRLLFGLSKDDINVYLNINPNVTIIDCMLNPDTRISEYVLNFKLPQISTEIPYFKNKILSVFTMNNIKVNKVCISRKYLTVCIDDVKMIELTKSIAEELEAIEKATSK